LGAILYQLRVPYLRRANGSMFPGLVAKLQNPGNSSASVEAVAELDSGAEYSLYDGLLASTIGLDLLNGKEFVFGLADGSSFSARILPVVIVEDSLGRFPLGLRFSIGPIRRNILGRDFFDLVQIGFREHHSEVYLTPSR
jgi:hypothetical protein